MIHVRGPRDDDRPEWLRMRLALWTDCPVDKQEREMDEYMGGADHQVFLAERPEGGLCGFLEAAIHPWAVGCDQWPVGYIEGWYVDADVRKAGIGRALVEAAEAWTRSRGCLQIASDALHDNIVSQQAHRAVGYEETYRVVFYKKDLA